MEFGNSIKRIKEICTIQYGLKQPLFNEAIKGLFECSPSTNITGFSIAFLASECSINNKLRYLCLLRLVRGCLNLVKIDSTYYYSPKFKGSVNIISAHSIVLKNINEVSKCLG